MDQENKVEVLEQVEEVQEPIVEYALTPDGTVVKADELETA